MIDYCHSVTEQTVLSEECGVQILDTGRSDSPVEEPVSYSRNLIARWDPACWAIGVAALLLGAVFVLLDIFYNQGKLIAPLDDVYIHLQYGSQLGRGHLFRFNTEDPISTGASSLLYALVLSVAYLVGFRHQLLLPFAVSLGIICFALTAICVYELGRRLVGRTVGVWSGLLVIVSGPLLWGSTSGMEIALVSLLVVSSLLFFTKEAPRGHFTFTPVLATLLALARPEGLVFATALIGAMWWTIFVRVRQRSSTRARAVRGAAWSLLPLFAGLGQLLFYKWATGTMAANGIQSKSILYDRPVFYPAEFVDRMMWNFRGFLDALGGWSTHDFTFPGAAFFVALGVFHLMTKRSRWRPLVIAMIGGLVVTLAAVSTLVTAHVQNLRYVQPFIPIVILLTVTGVYGLVAALQIERPRGTVVHAVLATVLMFSLTSLPTWALRLGQNAAMIRETDVSVGGWIRENLPPNASVGVKDVGAVKYLGDHRVVDLVGLTTNHMADAYNNGVGTLYEALRHMSIQQRPGYFAIYNVNRGLAIPNPGPAIDDLRDSGVLGSVPLATFTVKSPVPANGDMIVPFTQLSIYRADWSLAGTGDQMRTPGAVRDYLNVGDLASEQTHLYSPQLVQIGMQPMSILRRASLPDGRLVIDSGRRIIGGERFVAHNIIPGTPLNMTSRADARDLQLDRQAGVLPDLLVLINRVPVGVWHRSSGGTT